MDDIERFLSVSYGSGYGNGDGSGSGDGYGYGDGNGDGYGILEYCGRKVHIIDTVGTIIDSIHENTARGHIIQSDKTLKPCYIAKIGDYFAHGDTLRDAVDEAELKFKNNMPIEYRISEFVKEFPSADTVAKNSRLFDLHNFLTGSCRFGREQFCKDMGISLDGTMTIRKFIELTENQYNGGVIRQLCEAYEAGADN